jgi:polygalacturonase
LLESLADARRMSIPRREFLKSGLAVAAATVCDCGCQSLSVRPPPIPTVGWDQVPDILARIVPPAFPDNDFNVVDYGARGDGKTDCRPAFAAAIAACNKAGGGRVVVPAAKYRYLTNGPIHLLSNVNFYLEEGAVILFGANPEDYLPVVLVRYQGIRCFNYSPLIYANGQTDIAITGSGRFVGQALAWASWENLAGPDWALLQNMVADGVPVARRIFGAGHFLRLTMFEPYQCRNILVEGVTFEASPFWTMHPVFCNNVTIRNVSVLQGNSNDDGCDPDSCSDVLIEGCNFTTSDDNISLKAGYGADALGLPSCRNVVIRNCTATKSNWGAYTLGANTTANIENVFIENCVTQKSENAFYVKSNRMEGGTVQNVFIRSCKAESCNQFLCIQTDYGDTWNGSTPPLLTGIVVENMTCVQATVVAFLIEGDAENPIQYVSLSNIAVGSAPSAQQVSNTLYVNSSNITVGGQQIAINGLV